MTIYITNNIYIYVRMYIYEDVKPVCLYVLHNKKPAKTQRFCLKNFYILAIIVIILRYVFLSLKILIPTLS